MGICKLRTNILKYFIRSLYFCLFALFGAVFLIQTPLLKNQMKKRLIQAANNQNIHLEIEKIEGSLPIEWSLKGIKLTYGTSTLPIYIEKLNFRFSILPLFKKQLDVSYLKAYGGRINGSAFEMNGKGRLDLKRQKPIKVSHFLIEGEDFFVRLEGKVQENFAASEGQLAFFLPDLSIIGQKGSIMGMGQITKNSALFDCFSEELYIKDFPLKNSSFSLNATRNKSWWEGKAKISGGHSELPMEGDCCFRFTPSCQLLSVDEFHASGPELNFFGKVDLDPTLKCVEGTLFGQFTDLKVFRTFFPESYLKGQLGVKVDFQSFTRFQDLKCQIEMEGFEAYNTTVEALTLESTLYDIFGDLRGEFTIEGKNLKAPQAELSMIEIKSTFEDAISPFEFSAQGTWKDPIGVFGKGNWQKEKGGIALSLENLSGFAFTKPFTLCHPLSLEWNRDHFKVSNFSIDVAAGHLDARIDLTKNTSLIKAKADDFPLEFITLPLPHISMEGLGSLDIDLVSWENNLQGSCNVSLKRAMLLQEKGSESLTTKGSLQVHLASNRAQVHGELKATDGQFFNFFTSAPILYSHFPFKVSIDPDKPLSGEVTAEGKLEDLFNFINIGAHRIEGWLCANLYLSKTLSNPLLEGELELQNGLYENYYTGTYLEKIKATARAHRKTISFYDLEANDHGGGSVQARGALELNPEEEFPFTITAQLDQLHLVSFDTMSGDFNGELTISGNSHGALAKGDITVAKATFRIPDQLPSVIPELLITFINPPESIERKKVAPMAVSPLVLDLEIDVPKKAYIEGRGINAELRGKLHLTGTHTDFVADGALQLITGEYIFSGKVFNLSQGELIFHNKPTPSSYITLTGTCALPDVDVTVMLRGPLTSPKLTFQSSPQLPTSSLLSQILFNKDVSEISPIQALQLAQTVISLSGSSAPDILEKIRKTLGIDRLTIVTSENDPGKISLQIGKYLMRGVMLTLSQGAESRNVTVEVDLKRGITLQAEVNEQQQSKFSLKWHHHY